MADAASQVSEAEEFEFRARAEQEGATAPIAASARMGAPKSYRQKVSEAGVDFDKTVRRQGPGLKVAGNVAAGALETGAEMFSGMGGDIAGAITSFLSKNPKVGEKVRKAMSYQPETPSGRAASRYVGALTAPISDILSAAPNALTRHGMPISAQALRAAIDVGMPLPKAARVVTREAREAADTIQQGYHLRPSDIGTGGAGAVVGSAADPGSSVVPPWS